MITVHFCLWDLMGFKNILVALRILLLLLLNSGTLVSSQIRQESQKHLHRVTVKIIGTTCKGLCAGHTVALNKWSVILYFNLTVKELILHSEAGELLWSRDRSRCHRELQGAVRGRTGPLSISFPPPLGKLQGLHTRQMWSPGRLQRCLLANRQLHYSSSQSRLWSIYKASKSH